MRSVDTHAHVIPPALVNAMYAGTAPDGIAIAERDGAPWVVHPQGYRYPLLPEFHDVQVRLKAMDAAAIDAAVLSVAPTMFLYWIEAAQAVEAARVVNDAIAGMVAQAPDRFTGLAALPMQDPRAAVAELRRCVTEYGFRGAHVGPHIEGLPLDHDSLRPVLATAEELSVPLLVHPYYVGATGDWLTDFYLTNLQGNPWQTAVCASRLIFSGTLDALPGLDVVLVHGGGHLPYQVGRLDHGHRVRPEAKGCELPPSEYLRRFHFDTLTHSTAAVRFLIEQVGSDRVVLGTDMPFDMGAGGVDEQLAGLELSDAEIESIAHVNAERLFGRPQGDDGK
ncbi:amidohydrolase family protein [Pseudonocardia xinjiangensis]|uniref:Amidohydrolase n=1 Tax=Pseudonocardia xinjiangensis TaxID=75289 RepID=A0ABX1RIE9_9PSEU|nr:amidohydrolase family protein [Pseudonocardia xinjiangensis]NMH78875.1 amidohydrolase [Pseudonocardia xinjiangensis]